MVAAATALWGIDVARRALGGLEAARTAGGNGDAVRFERKRLDPLRKAGVRLLQATRVVRAVERFGDSYFAATDGGLVELTPQGRVVRRLGVLDGLSESDLTCLAAYGGRLYVGTRSRGLLAFDGERFEQYLWPDRDPKSITALAVDQGKLLVGTFAGGLLEFDGKGFREVRAGEGKTRLDAVNVLTRNGPRLYAGTFDGGLWVSEGGRWAHFTSADGLASERVVGVVESGGETLVATDFGLSAAAADKLLLAAGGERRAWRTVLTAPSLSGVAESAGRVTLCKDDGEVAVLTTPPGPAFVKADELNWVKPPGARSGARLVALDGSLWQFDSGGLRRTVESASAGGSGKGAGQISFADFGGEESAESPTGNLISALAFDAGGNLWAGSFRNGVDLFAPSGKRLGHVETDELREVNALVPDGAGGVLAATSQGIFRLDPSLHFEKVGTTDRTAAASVSHVALLGATVEAAAPRHPQTPTAARQLVAATPRGLSFDAQGQVRALTTVQGLPSNSVYSVWSDDGGRVYAGTLGGLAEVSAGRVVRVFKDSNSALTVNWVTAVCGAGGRLFVGTYGGGVFELLPSGDLRGFATETGRAFVNQNAMWGDDERLYVGTLDGALVFDLRSQRWARLRDELPEPSVLSVAGREGRVYFGTTGGIARFDKSFFDSAD
jgi:ligand-binding sensor domain-containing protein